MFAKVRHAVRRMTLVVDGRSSLCGCANEVAGPVSSMLVSTAKALAEDLTNTSRIIIVGVVSDPNESAYLFT
jgi:hypothetical protein